MFSTFGSIFFSIDVGHQTTPPIFSDLSVKFDNLLQPTSQKTPVRAITDVSFKY